MPRLKDDMSRVVKLPLFVQNPALGSQLSKEGRARIRRQDMKSRAFQPVFLDPLCRSFEHVRAVLIETENKTAVHLDAVVVKNRHPPRVVLRPRRFLPRGLKVSVGQRLESNKDTGAAR